MRSQISSLDNGEAVHLIKALRRMVRINHLTWSRETLT